ncbi:D-2-hydroxyacid dehydrogenase [Desulforhopalus singaporensis]|uniref:Phosphoglycerate dehydrogenase n=1 Tax=Desulforhopalus singaporensis TaxID=91360 RepID=A0A1H0TBE2_9BACT|nr:D-2-hydroxyacid dehydrogenase [Desulforhopalus singaporensis]SDP51383.1 Phosphoglycerate dehydrogenase [Desulforhopalus singaporensis]
MNRYQLVILSEDANRYRQLLEKESLPGLSIVTACRVEGAEKTLGECDILFGTPDLVAKALSYTTGRLQWVQSMWAGVTPLIAPSRGKQFVVTGVKSVFGHAIAEYVICYLLVCERNVIGRFCKQQQAQWDESTPGTLDGKNIGIMGLGSIGGAIARTAKFFRMNVFGFSRGGTRPPEVDRHFLPHQLADFVKELDYLVCVLPDTPGTSNLIDRAIFRIMRDTALIVNVGRGNAIDEASLVEALETGEIAGAVLDVFCSEPLARSHPLWKTPNTFITSHTAAKSLPEDVAPVFIANYRRLIDGRTLLGIVDPDRGY